MTDPIKQTLSDLLHTLGSTNAEIEATQATFDQRMKDLQLEAELTMKPMIARRDLTTARIHEVAEMHKEQLTEGKSTKLIKLSGGSLQWKTPRGGISFVKPDGEIKAFLKANGIAQFGIKVSRELSKSRMKSSPTVLAKLEAAGMITVGNGTTKLYLHPTQVELDTPDTGKER